MDPARGWRGPETPDPSLSAPRPALSSPCHALRLAWYLTLLFLHLPGCWGAAHPSQHPAARRWPQAPTSQPQCRVPDPLPPRPAGSTSPEQVEAPQVPPSHVCMLSVSHSRRQVPGMGLCSCGVLQVGVGGKDQAKLSIIMCNEEVKEAHCCLPQMFWLLLGRGPSGYQLKIKHEPFTWLSWHPRSPSLHYKPAVPAGQGGSGGVRIRR